MIQQWTQITHDQPKQISSESSSQCLLLGISGITLEILNLHILYWSIQTQRSQTMHANNLVSAFFMWVWAQVVTKYSQMRGMYSQVLDWQYSSYQLKRPETNQTLKILLKDWGWRGIALQCQFRQERRQRRDYSRQVKKLELHSQAMLKRKMASTSSIGMDESTSLMSCYLMYLTCLRNFQSFSLSSAWQEPWRISKYSENIFIAFLLKGIRWSFQLVELWDWSWYIWSNWFSMNTSSFRYFFGRPRLVLAPSKVLLVPQSSTPLCFCRMCVYRAGQLRYLFPHPHLQSLPKGSFLDLLVSLTFSSPSTFRLGGLNSDPPLF